MLQKNKKNLTNSRTINKIKSGTEAWQMSPKLEKLLEQIELDIAQGKNLIGPFDSAEEMARNLNLQKGTKQYFNKKPTQV